MTDPFDNSCFINCPFDNAYKPLLRGLLWVLLECGLDPRIASESGDSGQVRLEKVATLIEASRYSVHDLSRIDPQKPGDPPRFNMPFELGLDLGFRYATLPSKRCLVLEKETDRYRRALSDIAGQDIRAHGDDPHELIRAVRSWLATLLDADLKPAGLIWTELNDFTDWLEEDLREKSFRADDIELLEPPELMRYMRRWLEQDIS